MTGHTTFTRDGWAAFKADDRPGPIHMLNLVRLRDAAEYDDGRVATGAEAYAEYGRLSAPVLERLGGRIVWRASMELMLIGPQDKMWDLCFIAEYPEPGAFISMQRDPAYQKAVIHRQAGVLDSRLIRTKPLPSGDGFAG